ncbi:magnesium/cobalt transporter CorA [Thermococcus stetteri]|uniref:magnesium/cobalt transporter CorA n=1 Tax=Thermococcus stetteri TaxID=49900 RepID=UPI001AE1EB4D|nr:magnesium/cobalt transporter CorA [Thermococcus stetteri]MBP1912722.1 magnesium transporter [Thermococcus stetteri]
MGKSEGETRITAIAYSRDKFTSRKLSSLREALELKDHQVVWVNVDGLSLLDEIVEVFNIHKRPIKALQHQTSRVRVFMFPDYLFLVLHQVYESEGGLKREKVGLILKGNILITIQEIPGDVFDPIREGIREGEGLFRERGADYLLFALLEAIVENYVPIIERISSRIETLEGEILSRGEARTLHTIHHIRQEILFMRKTIFPLLEAFRRLRLEGARFFTEDTRPFLEGLHDHVRQVLEILEGQRELANSLIDLYYSTISMRTNDIIRILTVVSTIFIPLTFITGVYGMNFKYMPELQWRYGYLAVLTAMLVIAVGMLLYFRRKGWL